MAEKIISIEHDGLAVGAGQANDHVSIRTHQGGDAETVPSGSRETLPQSSSR